MDVKNVGQGRAFPEPVNAYDAAAGKYADHRDSSVSSGAYPLAHRAAPGLP